MEVRNLFGNNMSINLPNDVIDVSDLREIPDNQEVFTHSKTDQSLIVEILEYVQETDEQAVRTHLEDISKSNDATDTETLLVEVVPEDQLQMKECKSAYFSSSKQQVAKFNENARNSVEVNLALYRLPQFETDILISFNNPMSISPQSSSHGPMPVGSQPWTLEQFRQVICSLRLLNVDFLG